VYHRNTYNIGTGERARAAPNTTASGAVGAKTRAGARDAHEAMTVDPGVKLYLIGISYRTEIGLAVGLSLLSERRSARRDLVFLPDLRIHF
jgi:hypothetical protein